MSPQKNHYTMSMAVILKLHSKYVNNTMRDTCVKCHNEINILSVCYEHSTVTDTCVKPILYLYNNYKFSNCHNKTHSNIVP